MSTQYWWTCPRCQDRMEPSDRRADIERDQREHIAHEHPDVKWAPWELGISHWTEHHPIES